MEKMNSPSPPLRATQTETLLATDGNLDGFWIKEIPIFKLICFLAHNGRIQELGHEVKLDSVKIVSSPPRLAKPF